MKRKYLAKIAITLTAVLITGAALTGCGANG
jgi:hypothetical protein